MVQWLRIQTPNAGGPGLILVRELDPRAEMKSFAGHD